MFLISKKWPSPVFEGQQSFKGLIMHAHSYKEPQTNAYDFKDKRVIVVGIGNSGVDIANELSRACRQVYLATRSGCWVIPKYLFGRAVDHMPRAYRLLSLFPHSITHRLETYLLEKLVEIQQGSMRQWGLQPEGRINSMHPTVSQELLHRYF
jgi:dimethylaniline monooxygenase (N-oxide forming)